MVVIQRTLNLNAVEPAQTFKIPGVRVTRDPDTYVRLMLHVAKDHHGNQPEYRFRITEREKPKQKRSLSCRLYSGKISFISVEDLTEVGPELHQPNDSAGGGAASCHQRQKRATHQDNGHRQLVGGRRSLGGR